MQLLLKYCIACLLLLTTLSVQAQNTAEVEATGTGLTKADALQDALRAAIGQGAGVALKSETKVENFMVVSDAIATNTEGYISKYEILKEVPFPGRYEVTVKAIVSLDPIKADYQLLAKTIGGVRFMTVAEESKAKADKATYDFAIDKINSHLAGKKYRYVDKSRYESLKREAMNIMEEGDTGISYVQTLGIKADAQFIIVISDINTSTREGAFGVRNETKTNIVIKTYDNCTGEGLGTVIMESDWTSDASNSRASIEQAIDNGMDKLLTTFTSYIGDWVNNGTPIELRFYEMGTFRDLRDLRTKLKADPTFGGQMELTSVNNYTKLVCTYKSKSDDLADKILDYCDAIPSLVDKRVDVKLIYGRQMSFAPQSYVVPNMVKPAGTTTGTTTKAAETTKPVETKPATSGTKTGATGTKTGATKATTAKPSTTKTGSKPPIKGTSTTTPKKN